MSLGIHDKLIPSSEYICNVPPTRNPHKRTNYGKVIFVDAYAFRPMTESLALLSPYEFLMHWHCEPLFAPHRYTENPRSQWVSEEAKNYFTNIYHLGEISKGG